MSVCALFHIDDIIPRCQPLCSIVHLFNNQLANDHSMKHYFSLPILGRSGEEGCLLLFVLTIKFIKVHFTTLKQDMGRFMLCIMV